MRTYITVIVKISLQAFVYNEYNMLTGLKVDLLRRNDDFDNFSFFGKCKNKKKSSITNRNQITENVPDYFL